MLVEGSRHRALQPREAREEGASSRAEGAKGGNDKRDQARNREAQAPHNQWPSGALNRGVRRETNAVRLVRLYVCGTADI